MSKQACLALASIFCATGLAALAANPILGTWKMDRAKSSVSGTEMVRSQVITFTEEAGGLIRMSTDIVDAKGTPIKRGWVSKRDGRDVPFTSEFADTMNQVAAKDGYSGSWVSKKAGKNVNEGKFTISKDGKTLTWNWSGLSSDGKPISGMTVFDHQ